MSTRTLVVAPHPDDETLGCGGTLFRRRDEGATLAWLIVTGMHQAAGWSEEQISTRASQIDRIAQIFGFSDVFRLDISAAHVDVVPMSRLVSEFTNVFRGFQPTEVLLPHPGDIHSDHKVVFEAGAACTKWFRFESVRRVACYETLSETDFGLEPNQDFKPNWFIDITPYVDRKLEAMSVYSSEIAAFPFPRSATAIRALSQVRGATAGCHAAEAFQLLLHRE